MFLGGAGAVVAVSASSVVACSSPDGTEPVSPSSDSSDAVAQIRAQYSGQFDADYVDNAIVPFVQNSVFEGQRPV
ncbi:MAG: hypothetical protein WAL26_03290, partial [Mycobacterium sp.]